MTETAAYANVILPASSFLEKSGTFTNGERRIQRVNAAVEPLEGTKTRRSDYGRDHEPNGLRASRLHP